MPQNIRCDIPGNCMSPLKYYYTQGKLYTNEEMDLVLFGLFIISAHTCFAFGDSTLRKKDFKRDILLKTDSGDIRLRLSDSTPLHRNNFLKLVKVGYFDGLLFHRVINHFMIQSGDPDSRNAAAGKPLEKADLLTLFQLNSELLSFISAELLAQRGMIIRIKPVVQASFTWYKEKCLQMPALIQ